VPAFTSQKVNLNAHGTLGTFDQRGIPVAADPQGKDNLLLFPVAVAEASGRGAIRCRERLGGLLKYYSRAA
jgi:hypothetical protein